LGDANLMNTELEKYYAITAKDIQEYSATIFNPNNSNTLFYYANKAAAE
jgi:zinc protease